MADQLFNELLSRAQSIRPIDSIDKTLEDPSGLIPVGGTITGLEEAAPNLVNMMKGLKIGPLEKAGSALYELLAKFKAPPASAQDVVGSIPTLMGRRPAPISAKDMLGKVASRIPEARDMFTYPVNLTLKRPPGATAEYSREAAFRTSGLGGRYNPNPSKLQSGAFDRPAASTIDDLMTAAQAGKDRFGSGGAPRKLTVREMRARELAAKRGIPQQ